MNNTKPRILVSGNLRPPIGGIATYYQSLVNSSLSRQVDLLFVETSSEKRKHALSGKFSFSNIFAALEDCVRFAKAVIAFRPQLTHIATANGLSFVKHFICVLIARMSTSRVLIHPHCSFSALYKDQPHWWQWFFRQVIQLTNGVIVLSEEWDQLKLILPNRPVYYVPNGIDLSAYRIVALERKGAITNPSRLKVLYLGYLGKAKGSFDLVEAAKEILQKQIPVVLDLVGGDWTPGEVQQLKKQIDGADLHKAIVLHPPVIGSNKIEYFRAADVFIYPSYAEGMPIAVIEAMASGLPIIASKVGGLPEMISNGYNGILIDPGKIDQIVGALECLIHDPKLRLTMQSNSYMRAFERYDIEKIIPRLVSIYMKTLNKVNNNLNS